MKFNPDNFCKIYFWLLDILVSMSYYALAGFSLIALAATPLMLNVVFFNELTDFESRGNFVDWDFWGMVSGIIMIGFLTTGTFLYFWIRQSSKGMLKWLRGDLR